MEREPHEQKRAPGPYKVDTLNNPYLCVHRDGIASVGAQCALKDGESFLVVGVQERCKEVNVWLRGMLSITLGSWAA
jgi:hypothetical protein